MPVLSLLEGETSTRVVEVYPLAGRDNLVGRAEWADIGIVDASVSREHVRIQLRRDGWVAVSLSGQNPVTVDGRPVSEAPLSPGTVLQLGKVRVRFDDEDPRAQPTVIETGIPKGLVGGSPAAPAATGPSPPAPVGARASPPAVVSAAPVERQYDFDHTRDPLGPRHRPDTMLTHSVWPLFVWGLLLVAGIALWVLRETAADAVTAHWPAVASWVDG